MNLADAKARLTVHDLWPHFGFAGEPATSCRCPFHEDKGPSFSVTPDGALFHCFAGCGAGDAVDFFTLASGLPRADACRAFLALAGGSPVASAPRAPRPKPADVEAVKVAQRYTWPALESPLEHEQAMDALARLRHVSPEAVRLMAARGLLWFGAWKGAPAWIVTDGERVNAQARRMDGQPWPVIGAKAQTLPGSRAAWPVGARESLALPFVLLVEGGPDLLAAHHFLHAHGRAEDTAAVALLGAGNAIPANALPHFAGRRVRIMAHADEAGRTAARKWAEQLVTVNASTDAADFADLLMADGSPAKDLNDLTRLRPEDLPQLEDLIPR